MTDGEKFALKRRLKERYSLDKRRVYEIAEQEINSMKKTLTIAEILDKISAEIKDCIANEPMSTDEEIGMEKALDIIEKYKGDSE